ncbi:MAG: RHS repeat-associated core domain-containing protein, partial [Armatimonadota bacterium]
LYTVEYAYNELGQVVNKHYSGVGRPEKDISYHYDKSGRLIQTKSGDRIISEYTYDKNGNRLTSKTPRGKVNYIYDSANRLIKENQTSYSYDDAGNLTFIDAGSKSRTYAYDKENNLISAALPGGKKNVQGYSYDAYNLRTEKTFHKDSTSYCWFDNKLIGELDKNKKVDFIDYGYGFKNQQGDYYYITDRQGSVMALADKKGNIITVYEYDEFGNPVSSVNVKTTENVEEVQTGNVKPESFKTKIINFIKNLFSFNKPKDTLTPKTTTADQQVIFNKIESPIRYAGYYYDKESELYYLQSRYYDPKIGRFTQVDKIGYAAGLNLYVYCDNDPVNFVDPEGYKQHYPTSGTPEYQAAMERHEARQRTRNESLEQTRERISREHPEYQSETDFKQDPDYRAQLERCEGVGYTDSAVYDLATGGKGGVLIKAGAKGIKETVKATMPSDSDTGPSPSNPNQLIAGSRTGTGTSVDIAEPAARGSAEGNPVQEDTGFQHTRVQEVGMTVISYTSEDGTRYGVYPVFLWGAVEGARYYKIEFKCNGNPDGAWWGQGGSKSTNGYLESQFGYSSSVRGFTLAGMWGPISNRQNAISYYQKRFNGWTATVTAIK